MSNETQSEGNIQNQFYFWAKLKIMKKTNYQISYSPYSVFNLNLIHRNFTTIKLSFSFNFNERFFKQLKKRSNALQEVNRYDFLQGSH
ncbi:hypothetical protein DMB91_08715 [Campylobacter sp. MIT 97-5078]|nr:hypothetical protein LR59_04515 [Campylobacter sp. MIT 97-5078]TQR22631.1 hypothetical protein DMB91_08715 [Campylobacter sp. MIT 97-5078]